MNYQQNQRLAQAMAQFQPVQNGGLAGALAQGLAGFGSGYFGGQAVNQQNQVRTKLAEALAKGDTTGAMSLLATSGIPEYENMGLKSQLDLAEKDAESKRKQAMLKSLGFGDFGGTETTATGGTETTGAKLAAASVVYPELAPLATFMAGQEKQNKDSAKSLAEVTPPGFKIVDGVVPSADDAKKMKSLNEAQINLSRLMDELGAIYDKMGGATPVGVDADLARQKYEQAKIQIKELEQLGAIQAPDIPIIEGMMPNPSSPIEYGKEQIGIKSTKPRIDAFKNELQNRVNVRAKVFGYEVMPDQSAKPAQPAQPTQPAGADANISGALQAIQSGAPRDAVKSRLLQNGYTQEQLKAAGL